MTNPPIQSPSADRREYLLDGHLASALTQAEQSELQAIMLSDLAFAAEVELQERAAASLSRLYSPAPLQLDAPAIAGQIRPAKSDAVRGSRRWIGIAAAAVLLLTVSGLLWVAFGQSPRTPANIYREIVAAGFKPPVPCSNDAEYFGNLVKMKLGQQLAVNFASAPQIAFTGWGYKKHFGTPLSDNVMMLMVKNDTTPIVIFMDKAVNDRDFPPPKPGVSVFKQTYGKLVIYEVSPLDKPTVLPMLSAAQ